jgi:hypothetical protein
MHCVMNSRFLFEFGGIIFALMHQKPASRRYSIHMKLILSAFFYLFLTHNAQALAKELRYDNFIYESKIETVLLSKSDQIYNPMPVIGLNSSEILTLTFDELKNTNDFYQFSVVHCDASWKPSQMLATEYISGNQVESINQFSYSTNTFQKYVHYKTSFPTADMQITRSGNFLLKVFRNFDEEDLIITRRFMVLDNKVRFSGTVTAATNPEFRFSKHEIDFTADYKEYEIPNPFLDVKAVIMQNNDWNNAIYSLKPLFVNNNELIFNYEDKNLMDAGHEFRFFDIRSLRFFSNNVAEKYFDSLTNVVLRPEDIRAHLNYSYNIDYNGKRVIANKDGSKIAEDADYAMVHFYLRSPNEMNVGKVYLYGELTDWRIQEKYRLDYLPQYKGYYRMAKLKQSYYNYHYVVWNEAEKKIDKTFTEGNHFETENDYHILLYHKNPFYGYDELIGYHLLNSGNLGVQK